MYGRILANTDPKKTTASPGRMSLSISPKVQESKGALHALCNIFELCIDFSDIDNKTTEQHLEIFLTSSAAVLFGSNFQTERDALNATEYAMDELARFSSFALVSMLLSYPDLIPVADRLLGKRCTGLLNYLFSAAELSIQKSLLAVLRILYEHTCKTDASPRNLKSRIENGLSATRFGNGLALEFFKTLDTSADDSTEQCQRIVTKLFETNPIETRCIKTEGCTVRMNGKVNGTMKKGGAQRAAVDWNKNSIVVYVRNQVPAHFPLYSIVHMKWMSGRKEVRLRYRNDSELQESQLSIQFKAGYNRGYLCKAIEARIQHFLGMVGLEVEPVADRKISEAVRTKESDDDVSESRGTRSEGQVPSGGDDMKEGESAEYDGNAIMVDPHNGNHIDDGQSEEGPNYEAPSNLPPLFKGPEDTVFSLLAADGILMRDNGKVDTVQTENHLVVCTPPAQVKRSAKDPQVSAKCDVPVNKNIPQKAQIRNTGIKKTKKDEAMKRTEDRKLAEAVKNKAGKGNTSAPVQLVDVVEVEESESGTEPGSATQGGTSDSQMDEIDGDSDVQDKGQEPEDPNWRPVPDAEEESDGQDRNVQIEDAEMEADEEEEKNDGESEKMECSQSENGDDMEDAEMGNGDEQCVIGAMSEVGNDGKGLLEQDETIRLKLLAAVRGVMKVR